MAAGYELMTRIGKEYQKPAWNLPATDINGKSVRVTESVVLDKPFCRLVHFHRDVRQAPQDDPKVLLVAPLSGHHATLLRDTVRALLPGHDVYVTDWIDARMVPLSAGPFHPVSYTHLWITGPSAMGSENGTPSSRTSAPASTSACIRGTVAAGEGSPAAM